MKLRFWILIREEFILLTEHLLESESMNFTYLEYAPYTYRYEAILK